MYGPIGTSHEVFDAPCDTSNIAFAGRVQAHCDAEASIRPPLVGVEGVKPELQSPFVTGDGLAACDQTAYTC